MSFSSEIKNLICELEEKPCCRTALLYGLLLFSGSFSAEDIRLVTASASVARYGAELCAHAAGVESLVEKRGGVYCLTVETEEERLALLARFGHAAAEPSLRIRTENLSSPCCEAAFLRGVFLSCGTVIDPGKDYHLEFVVPFYHLADDLADFFTKLGRTPKRTVRKTRPILYFKESGAIEDILTLLGVQSAAFRLMDIKIYRDVRNRANRVANFETANLRRTVNAAWERRLAAEYFEAHGGIDLLPEELRDTARLCLSDPPLTLREFSERLDPPLTRSGVNHRLAKIVELYQKASANARE